jgi:hypothetical protein
VASTITVQQTATWSLSFLEQQPLLINGMEPALSSANLILQTMLGPPFVWPWNRAVLTFSTGAQDYVYSNLNNFGFLEGGTVTAVSGGNKAWEISVKQLLNYDSGPARPGYCSPFIDDGNGNITFRLHPAPDQAYNVALPYQRKPPVMMSMASTWSPVPDELGYVYQWGFLAMMSLIGADARFNEYNAKFISSLLGNQGGLTEMERNIFLTNWTRVMSQLQGTQLETSERYRARAT